MLADFHSVDAAPQGVAIHAQCGGAGPPLLLLSGHSQTHLMWHRVAPALAQHFSAVAADLRGYGDSARVPADADHAAHSKRTMALECGHYIAEEAPEALLGEAFAFFKESDREPAPSHRRHRR
jgi:alpha-beta hydrolase superfamily lysophospholipase